MSELERDLRPEAKWVFIKCMTESLLSFYTQSYDRRWIKLGDLNDDDDLESYPCSCCNGQAIVGVWAWEWQEV